MQHSRSVVVTVTSWSYPEPTVPVLDLHWR